MIKLKLLITYFLLLLVSCGAKNVAFKGQTNELNNLNKTPIVLTVDQSINEALLKTLLIQKGFIFEPIDDAKIAVSQETKVVMEQYYRENGDRKLVLEEQQAYVLQHARVLYQSVNVKFSSDTANGRTNKLSWRIGSLPFNPNTVRNYQYFFPIEKELINEYPQIVDSLAATLMKK